MATRRRGSVGAKTAQKSTTNIVEDITSYIASKGRFQAGDEPTANFSDDENSEDDVDTRRKRREATRLVKASVNHLASSMATDKDLRRGQIVSMNTVDSDNNIGIDLVGVEHTDEETFRRARNTDRSHNSQLINDKVTYKENGTQRTVEAPGFRMTLSTTALVQRWLDSQNWKRDLGVASICLLVGVIAFIFVWREFAPYWR